MLIFKDGKNDLKIYYTNNLLLVTKGDNVEKEIFIDDESCLEEELLEIKESMA